MKTKKRPLTLDEQKQLNISKIFHNKRVKEKFSWKDLFWVILFEIIFISLVYHFEEYTLCWIAKIGMLVLPLFYYLDIDGKIKDKVKSGQLLNLIESLEKNPNVDILEYNCNRAIQMMFIDDEVYLFVLEIGKNKLLFWKAHYFNEAELLPNTKFEILENQKLEQIFGTRIYIHGERFQPIIIQSDITDSILDSLPIHNTIITSTIDDYFKEIEELINKN